MQNMCKSSAVYALILLQGLLFIIIHSSSTLTEVAVTMIWMKEAGCTFCKSYYGLFLLGDRVKIPIGYEFPGGAARVLKCCKHELYDRNMRTTLLGSP